MHVMKQLHIMFSMVIGIACIVRTPVYAQHVNPSENGIETHLLTVNENVISVLVRPQSTDTLSEAAWNTFMVVVPPEGNIRVTCRDQSCNNSVLLERLFWFRGNRIAGIRVLPETWELDAGSVVRSRDRVVEIQFTPWSAEEPVLDSASMHAVIRDLVVNPGDLNRWRIRGAPVDDFSERFQFFPDNQAVKLSISSDGICRITDEIDFSDTDPRNIQVFSQGEEVPVYVHGEADGVFDPGDYLEFLCYRYRNPDGTDNLYTDTNVYWVTWGEEPGERLSTLDGSIPGAGLAADYVETLFLDENHVYAYGDYYWDSIRVNDVKSFNIPVDHKTGSMNPAMLRVRLLGMTSVQSVDPDHHVIMYWNENPLHDGYWDANEEYLLELPLPVTWVNNGQNQLHIYFPGDTGAGEIDGCFVDWFELVYSRQYSARDNHLDFADPVMGFPGRTDFEISNFNYPDLSLYRSDTNQKIINFEITPSGNQYVLNFADQTGETAAYTAAAITAFVTPDKIEIHIPADLQSPSNEADYLIVYHPEFSTELQILTDHLEAKGLRVFSASIDDIFDVFSYGIWDPEAVRSFCSFTYYNWSGIPPSYLLLVGDSSWDYKQYLPGSRPVNFLPAYGKIWTNSSLDPFDRGPYDASELVYGEPMVDDQFVCISGKDNIPEMAIGRLTVQTKEQLRIQTQKIINYEAQSRDQSWQDNLLFINGGVGDAEQDMFRNQVETIIGSIIYPTGRYWHLSRIFKESDHREWGWYEEDIIRALNTGRLLVNFLGHAGTWSWEAMFNFDDIGFVNNADKLPIITSMTCNTARFANPLMDCFGEQFTTGTNNLNGAAAFWGGCNFGGYWSDYYLAYFFYDYLLKDRTRVLGDCILRVKIKTLVQYPGYNIIIEPYTLLGDPALAINLPSEPVIYVAGFMNTRISAKNGGHLQIMAFVLDPDGPDHIDQVEILYAGQPTGVFLVDDGNNGDLGPGDSVYGISVPIGPNLLDPFVHPLGIRATDIEGNVSDSYPALKAQ
jgi:Peptidase family C25